MESKGISKSKGSFPKEIKKPKKHEDHERVKEFGKINLCRQRKIFRFKIPFERYFYRDFIWKIAASHGYKLIYPEDGSKKFKIYVGGGNNSCLIRTLFKRRKEWWTFTDRMEEADLVWTQLKIVDFFQKQK